MLVFPNCKINLGLHVVNKRPDGFHNIETVFYPVSWCDALEVVTAGDSHDSFVLTQSGLPVAGSDQDNLIFKAWELVKAQHHLPALKVHLHKNIPMGAGLGGGSADAAFFINVLNDLYSLGISPEYRMELASALGSDCAFFIRNQPVYAVGRGNEFTDLSLSLSPYYILIIHPGVHSNTREAYEGLHPAVPAVSITDVLKRPVQDWKALLVNDFEKSIFGKYPMIADLKQDLYSAGALYASMSGSGSAVFAIFDREPRYQVPQGFSYYLQKPAENIL